MLGVGGTRQHLGRKALRGGGPARPHRRRHGPQAQKRALLRTLKEQREARREGDAEKENG